MKRTAPLVMLALLLVFALAVPAVGITDGGVPDTANEYSHVGLMVAMNADGVPMWRCSGTLLSEKVFLTAGHCTSGADSVEIWFDWDVESGIPGNGYPYTGDVSGKPYTHPEYTDAAFFLHDVGVVVLNKPYRSADVYGAMPSVDQLDQLKTNRGEKDVTFTAVGYGLQEINPVFVQADRVRMVAHPHLIQINVPGFTGDFSLLLSNNNSTGGTCFGDSGGPNFLGDSNIVAGVTSFGINGNCAGTGGVFRMDRQNVLDFVNSFLTDRGGRGPKNK